MRRIRGEYVLVHRRAWTEAYGPIPDGLQIDHICRNKQCINVAHMRLATSAENLQNVPARGGSSRFRGVSWSKKEQRWVARFGRHFIGQFTSETAAADAAAAWRRRNAPFATE